MIRFKTYSAIKPVSCEIIESSVRDNPGKEIIFAPIMLPRAVRSCSVTPSITSLQPINTS